MAGKVLVVGSSGQLGQCFRFITQKKTNYVFATHEEFDICDKKMMSKYLKKNKDIKVIINCAAYTNVAKAEEDYEEYEKADLINHIGVGYLAEICKKFDVFLIHFATDYMYESYLFNGIMKREPVPITEKEYDFLEPEDTVFYSDKGEYINHYGLSKLRGVREIFKIQPRFVVIVVSWLFSQFGKNFVKTIYNAIENNKPCSVVYNQVGSPTYGVDLAKYVVDVIDNRNCDFGEGNIINFANFGTASWYDLASAVELIRNLFESNKVNMITPTTKNFDNVIRPEYSVLNLTKMYVSNIGKPYVRHWLEALEECVFAIRRDILLEKNKQYNLLNQEK